MVVCVVTRASIFKQNNHETHVVLEPHLLLVLTKAYVHGNETNYQDNQVIVFCQRDDACIFRVLQRAWFQGIVSRGYKKRSCHNRSAANVRQRSWKESKTSMNVRLFSSISGVIVHNICICIIYLSHKNKFI